MTRLSEHIMRVTDVLRLSAVTIRGLVLQWLEAEGLDVRPSQTQRLLRGIRLSHKKPAKCVKELQSAEQQHDNTHQQFIKLADEHLWRQRRPRPEPRRDLLPPPAGASDRVGPPRRQTSSDAGQHE